jgi:hypothetical protein
MDTPDRAALNAAFAQQVARVLGSEAGYLPAWTCPRGHRGYFGPATRIGDLCFRCVPRVLSWEAVLYVNDPTWHPEWRIPPGKPKDFCGSLDLTCGVLSRLGVHWSVTDRHGRVWSLDARAFHHANVPAGAPTVPDLATALVQAALVVLERQGPP